MEIFATEDGTIAQMKVATRTFVEEGAMLLTYKSASGIDVHVKSNAEGIVTFDRTIRKNKNFDEGTLLATISPCQHEIVMKDMCADCGKDLREKDGRAGQRVENAAANVSMIHHVPELHVSNTLAQKIGSEDQQRLLSQKKLILLVDLDQTLIHTTNRPFTIDPDKQSEDIFKYTIGNVEYTTKLRPYTREFLDSMSKLYELHIVTYGQRLYAHTIAEKIQNGKSYFDQRVLSRDELFSAQHKTSNLKALFPCGEQLIAIIDDRADVWQYSEALVQVKPYRFFKEVGDINAPVGGRVEAVPVNIEENAEDDNILQTIERVLTDTHRNFFNHYERTQDIRDVKVVISYLKKQVLRDLVIVLSGVVPIGIDMERCDAYRLCTQFGAKVDKHITDETTHVIAARWGTDKVHMANKKSIPVVSPLWLYACVEKWHRAEEKEFEVTKDTAPPRGRPVGGHLIPEIHCIDTIAKETINNMEHEVDEALSDEDDDDDAGDEEKEEDVEEDEKEENDDEDNTQRSPPKRRREEDDSVDYEQDVYGEKKQCRREEVDDDDDEEQEGMEYGGDDEEEITMDGPPVDEDDEEYDDMAAMIERQISHDED